MANRPTVQGWGVTAPDITGKMADGSDYFPPESYAEWSVNSGVFEGAPAQTTVSRGAESGRRHFLCGVSASFNTARIGVMRVYAGSTEIWAGYVHNFRDIQFDHPIAIPENMPVSAELGGSQTGQLSALSIHGYTI